jgi:hypothetical protein
MFDLNTTYSFKDVTVGIYGPGGAFSLKDGAAEEGIEVSPRDDKNMLMIGANGDGVHSLRADKSATVTLTLLKNADANARLSTMYNVQQESSTLWGKNTITLTSLLGEVLTLIGVAMKKRPSTSFQKDATVLVWEFEAISWEYAASI